MGAKQGWRRALPCQFNAKAPYLLGPEARDLHGLPARLGALARMARVAGHVTKICF